MMKPITTEKAVKLIELENTLLFEFDRKTRKADIKKEIEGMFNVRVANIRTLVKSNTKRAYVRLDKKNPAIDVATKLGMI
jgi:large subunit ribosomal protein L23